MLAAGFFRPPLLHLVSMALEVPRALAPSVEDRLCCFCLAGVEERAQFGVRMRSTGASVDSADDSHAARPLLRAPPTRMPPAKGAGRLNKTHNVTSLTKAKSYAKTGGSHVGS